MGNLTNNYSKMSTEDFDRNLRKCLRTRTAEQVLLIPGIYEVVSEHFNNEVLYRWEAEQYQEAI